MPSVINGSDNFNTGTPIVSLGVGQTWQNVSGSRAVATTYTNSTGKPIFVAISGWASAGNGYVVVDSVTIYSGLGRSTYFNTMPISFIVPSGSSYSCWNIDSISNWAELR